MHAVNNQCAFANSQRNLWMLPPVLLRQKHTAPPLVLVMFNVLALWITSVHCNIKGCTMISNAADAFAW